MTIVFAVTSTGTPDNDDKGAIRLVVNEENLRRVANSETPLPVDTPANLRTSYLTVRTAQVQAWHTNDAARAKTTETLRANGLTQVQIDQLAVAASERINNGEPFSSILADIQTP
jgi:hypothetical protein